MQRVPFYRRLRVSMILTVLLIVTLISGTSILISYQVYGEKIEEDVQNEFVNTEELVKDHFNLHSRRLRLVSEIVAEELMHPVPGKSGYLLSPAERFTLREQKEQVDIISLFNTEGQVVAVSEKKRATAQSLSSNSALLHKLKGERSFSSVFFTASAYSSKKEKIFFMIAAAPVQLPDTQEKGFVLSGHILDSSFLIGFPIHSHMRMSIISDNIVLALKL